MNPTTKILSLLAGIACFAPIGCDQLTESLMGQPNPNAAVITPAGPVGIPPQNDRMLANESPFIDSTGPSNWSMATPSPFVTTAAVTELPNSDSSAAVKTATGTNWLASTITDSNGLQVPPAEKMPATSAGKIYIDRAHVKFVDKSDVAAQADGLITSLNANEGDLLVSNSLIIQLDDRLANSELEVTKKEYKAALEKAQDDSELQYSKASNDVAREEYLIAKDIDDRGAGTATELNKKWLEYKRADLAITVAEVKNKQDLSAAEVSKAKQGAAEVQVQLRKIASPFDGIVVKKLKQHHDWVRAGEVILRIVSMEQLRVVGQVRVEQLTAAPHELLGAPASVDIELFPGKIERVSAKVGFVSPVMESSSGYEVWLQIPNIKANDQWVFREGMPAKIEISTR